MKLQTKIWLVSSLLIAVIIGGDYVISRNMLDERINKELLHDAREVQAMLMAMRRVYQRQFLDSGLPLDEKTIGFLPAHATSLISADFPNWSRSGLSFNNVSDRPRNPRNQAAPHELEAMEFFRANPDAKERLAEIRDAKGNEFFHFTAPIWTEKHCLKCHGEKDQAPESIAEKYDTAYGYRLGDLRGVMSIKVPVGELREHWQGDINQSLSMRLAGYGVLLLLIGFSMEYMVTRRIAKVEGAAKRLSGGDYSARCNLQDGDEIAMLGRTFDHMGEHLQADVSALRNAEEQARQLAEEKLLILNVAGEGIFGLDNTGKHTFANPAAVQMLGFSLEELIGQPSHQTWHRLHPNGMPYPEQDCPISRTLRVGTVMNGEEFFLRKDGSFFPVVYFSAPILKAGEIQGAVVTFMDISEQKRIKDELNRLNEELELRVQEEVAKNRGKDHLLIQQSRLASMGEMIHNISHHWRQPLNALAVLLANIKDAHDFGELDKQLLDNMMADGKHLIQKMSGTIDDFRHFFRADAAPCVFDAAKGVEEALAIMEAALKNDLIEVHKDISAEVPVFGYPGQFAQVMLNILANAKESIQQVRTEAGCITVSLHSENNEAVLIIADNGGGIPAEILPRIFDPYFTTKEQGSGIGLFMTKMILERNMNGRIMISSHDGETVVRVILPLAETETPSAH